MDDSLTVRRLVEVVLVKHGFEVHAAADGEAGLELAARVLPDLVIVDFVMPKMYGHVFCKRLRAEPRTARVPIVLCSSKSDSIGYYFDDLIGVVDKLTKPFDPKALVELVQRVVGRGDVTPEPAGDTPRRQDPAPAPAPLLSANAAAPAAPPSPPSVAPKERADAPAPAEPVAPATACAVLPAPLLAQLGVRVDESLRTWLQTALPTLLRTTVVDALRDAGLLSDERILLSASIEQLSLADALNFVHTNRLSGRFALLGGDLVGEAFLDNGMLVFADLTRRGSQGLLAELRANLGTREGAPDLLATVARARASGKPLGKLLTEVGLATADTLQALLLRHVQLAFHALLEVQHGTFSFARAALPPHLADVPLRLPLPQMLMEGLRRFDETVIAQRELTDDDLVLVHQISNEDAGIRFNEHELDMFTLVDGRKTLREIVAASGLRRPEALRVCHRLVRAGVLRPRLEQAHREEGVPAVVQPA